MDVAIVLDRIYSELERLERSLNDSNQSRDYLFGQKIALLQIKAFIAGFCAEEASNDN